MFVELGMFVLVDFVYGVKFESEVSISLILFLIWSVVIFDDVSFFEMEVEFLVWVIVWILLMEFVDVVVKIIVDLGCFDFNLVFKFDLECYVVWIILENVFFVFKWGEDICFMGMDEKIILFDVE